MGLLLRNQSGQLPGKTIIFALSQRHALNLAKALEEMYPQFPALMQVITVQDGAAEGRNFTGTPEATGLNSCVSRKQSRG